MSLIKFKCQKALLILIANSTDNGWARIDTGLAPSSGSLSVGDSHRAVMLWSRLGMVRPTLWQPVPPASLGVGGTR